jgi:hypothetical protein
MAHFVGIAGAGSSTISQVCEGASIPKIEPELNPKDMGTEQTCAQTRALESSSSLEKC